MACLKRGKMKISGRIEYKVNITSTRRYVLDRRKAVNCIGDLKTMLIIMLYQSIKKLIKYNAITSREKNVHSSTESSLIKNHLET